MGANPTPQLVKDILYGFDVARGLGDTVSADSLQDLIDNALSAEREQARRNAFALQWLYDNCKIIHFTGDYPIEHNPHANKNGRFLLDPLIDTAYKSVHPE